MKGTAGQGKDLGHFSGCSGKILGFYREDDHDLINNF